MATDVNHREVECKLKVDDHVSLAARLAELGAVDHGAVLERNWVFDTADGELRNRSNLLRVRDNGQGHLTFKGPLEGGGFKQREELETEVACASTIRNILRRLGYEEIWYYEKQRHTWFFGDCEILLDALPEIGLFIEVEGPSDEKITGVLGQLNLDPNNHLPGSYLSLFAELCRLRGEQLRDMRFADSERNTP